MRYRLRLRPTPRALTPRPGSLGASNLYCWAEKSRAGTCGADEIAKSNQMSAKLTDAERIIIRNALSLAGVQ